MIQHQVVMNRNDICIYVEHVYGVNNFYIDSFKYIISCDDKAAKFLNISCREYRRLMKNSFKGFVSGKGKISFHSLQDAKEAMEVFEARLLATTLGA